MSLTTLFSRRMPLCLLLILPLLTGCPARLSNTNRPLYVTFLDVGQGDSAIVEAPTGEVAVIDGGGTPHTNEAWGNDPGHRTVVPFLRSRGVRQVNILVASHPDDDHVQGLIAVVDNFPVRAALVNGQEGTGGAYQRLLTRLRARHIPVLVGRRGQALRFGQAYFAVLAPGDAASERLEKDNNQSLVLNLHYGKSRILFTGDAEAQEETTLLEANADARADVLKVGHHGSRFSSTPRFLSAVQPRLAVISAGRHNRYGHPTPETLARLHDADIPALRTDTNGAITLETDGSRIRAIPKLP